MAVAKRMLSGDGYAFENVEVADAAKALTASTYAITDAIAHVRAFITVDTGQLRYRYDGSDATATVGHLAQYGDSIIIEGTVNIQNFRAIRTGDRSASLSVTYEAVHG